MKPTDSKHFTEMSHPFLPLNIDADNLYYAAGTFSITIHRGNRTLTLYENGKVRRTYPIAIGKPQTPTPSGTFTIINKAPNPGGPYGARWLGLNTPGIGIHGTNNPPSIGTQASKGCIRMYNKDVIELYNIVPIRTVVKII